MKLSIKSPILKSSAVEVISPVTVECQQAEKALAKTIALQIVPFQYTVISQRINEWVEQAKNASVAEPPLEAPDPEPVSEACRQAEIEAQEILAAARQKADELLAAAQLECENLRPSLEAEIRREISASAREEGYEQGLKEGAAEADKMCIQARDYLQLAERALHEEFGRVDQELVRVCLKISERLARTNMALNPQALLHIIHDLELIPKQKHTMKLHVSVQDWEWIRNLPAEARPSAEVIADQVLKPGDAYLECDEGIFEAAISSQVEKLEHYLLEELSHGLEHTGK